jgi:hypothetical protein
MSRHPNSEATDTNLTRPIVQTTQLNNPAPPIIPPQPLLPSSQPYQIPGGYVVQPWDVVPPWDVVEPSTHAGVNQNILSPQMNGRRIVQGEDAGTLPGPGENEARLPPEYKEVWSQGHM